MIKYKGRVPSAATSPPVPVNLPAGRISYLSCTHGAEAGCCTHDAGAKCIRHNCKKAHQKYENGRNYIICIDYHNSRFAIDAFVQDLARPSTTISFLSPLPHPFPDLLLKPPAEDFFSRVYLSYLPPPASDIVPTFACLATSNLSAQNWCLEPALSGGVWQTFCEDAYGKSGAHHSSPSMF